jgi:hypothetical protein
MVGSAQMAKRGMERSPCGRSFLLPPWLRPRSSEEGKENDLIQ